jgi:hypothetical protein
MNDQQFYYAISINTSALIGVAGLIIGIFWKMFHNFRTDVKESMKNFVDMHLREYNQVGKAIEDLYCKERQDRDQIMINTQKLMDIEKDHDRNHP